jgi:hypothetical protein
MSFDLTFFRWNGQGDPLDEHARLLEIELDARPPLPASEAARLRSLLTQAHPAFATTPLPPRDSGAFQLFDESLALSLDVDSVLIEVNLTYFQSNSTAAFTSLARIGEALAADGFQCFDPQAGELVDWANAVDSMRDRYDALPRKLANAVPLLLDAPPPKPWWKFW